MALRASLPLVLFSVVVCSAGACLPIPHAHRRSPAIRGRVLDGGAPVGGLTVKRVLTTRRDDCVLDGDVALTDAQGSFEFERRYEFRAVVPLYGDPVAPMVLCIYRDGEVVGSAQSTMMGGAPTRAAQGTANGSRRGVARAAERRRWASVSRWQLSK